MNVECVVAIHLYSTSGMSYEEGAIASTFSGVLVGAISAG